MWSSATDLARAALAVALVGAGAQAATPAPDRTLLATPPRAVADFELTSHQGKPLRLSQLQGAPVLVFFGFSHCPSVCPAALQQLRELEKNHVASLGRTRIAIISVDGERDTPAVMASWLRGVSPNFIGLTGASAKVQPIAASFSAVFYKQATTASGYDVQHSSQIFLVDADGRLRATFFNAPVKTMAEVTASVLAEKKPPKREHESVASRIAVAAAGRAETAAN